MLHLTCLQTVQTHMLSFQSLVYPPFGVDELLRTSRQFVARVFRNVWRFATKEYLNVRFEHMLISEVASFQVMSQGSEHAVVERGWLGHPLSTTAKLAQPKLHNFI